MIFLASYLWLLKILLLHLHFIKQKRFV